MWSTVYPIVNENILEKQKIRGKEKSMTSLYLSSKKKEYSKRIYTRERKEQKKSMR